MSNTTFLTILGLLILGVQLSYCTDSHAQSPPMPGRTTNVSGTIAATSTFQQVFNATPGRLSCAIQNNGVNNMNVFFGLAANATIAASLVLAPGSTVNCHVGTSVITDAVALAGTVGDTFYAASQ